MHDSATRHDLIRGACDASPLVVNRMSPACGAEITGIDLAGDLEDATIAAIRQALLEHLVLFFRDQHLTPERLIALGRRFGDLIVHPNLVAEGPYPEVITVRKEPDSARIIGSEWHTDTTCLAAPPMGAILYAEELPPLGGDTLFANQYLAYEALSDGMKAMIEGLRAVHNDTRVAGPQAGLNATRAVKNREHAHWTPTENVHPVVRTHPETRRRALFVNVAYTRRFDGWSAGESAPLLEWLYRHSTRPEFTCRFRWSAGAAVFWDNRCLVHIAMNDYAGHRRVLKRVQIAGDEPFLHG